VATSPPVTKTWRERGDRVLSSRLARLLYEHPPYGS
jgi:hypothetical protein